METNGGLDIKWLGRLLKKRFHDAKPVDVVDVVVESAVPKGENYTSDVSRVHFKTITAAGTKKTFSMIVKTARTSEMAQRALAEFSVFRGECKIYTTILKNMEDLMDEFNDKRDTLWANMYGFKPYKNMVLEDLKDQNYILIDRTKWQNLEHSLLVLRAVGRYHAMTKILIKRGFINQDDKGNFWAKPGHVLTAGMIAGALSVMSQAMMRKAGSWDSEWVPMGKRIETASKLLTGQIGELYEKYDNKFEVLNHGDLWSSNMMFKLMEYTGTPVSVKLLDFQLPHLNSFIWDVTYFMYVSVKPSVRRAHRDQLLRAYHQSLADNLKFFKYDGYIPTLEDVLSEDKRMSPVQMVFLSVIMPITSATGKDAFDLEKVMSEKPADAFNEKIFTEEKFVKEVCDDLREFAKLKII